MDDTDDYAAFLASKAPRAQATGIDPGPMPAHMQNFRGDAAAFALRQGRAAIFYDTGMGKTSIELEVMRQASEATNGFALLLTELAVAKQIENEAHKWGYNARVIRSQDDAQPGINICNYDQLDNLNPLAFGAVALDESDILKNMSGKTSRALIEAFKDHQFRLCATATPAPNDHMELGMHAEFLGIMRSVEMLSRWFINDTSTASQSWRLKKHAEQAFWDWMATWSRCAETPADLGYDATGFILPKLHVIRHKVAGDTRAAPGMLFAGEVSATNMFAVKRQTAEARAQACAALVLAEPDEPWIIWVDTDVEADAVRAALPDVYEIRGSHSRERKETGLIGFADGTIKRLLTKPSIAGRGMNYQICARMAYVGRSFSYRDWYQSVRRCWRYGQAREVFVHLMVAEGEEQIGRVIDRKAADHATMKRAMAAAMKRATVERAKVKEEYLPQHVNDIGVLSLDHARGANWDMYNGDCVSVAKQLPDHSVGFSVYSVPFAQLFTYSSSAADLGNTADDKQFFDQYRYMIREKLRLTKPGRLSAVHCSDIPRTKWKEGLTATKRFSDMLCDAHEDEGWHFLRRVTIWRDPVVEMTRTKALNLLYKQLCKDSTKSFPGMADYVMLFRAPGDNEEPVAHERGGSDEITLDQWQKWASPVWMDINQTDTLNVAMARDGADERHLCPLQLPLIERAILMWSNRGDLVLSPYAGVGSEGFVALKQKRRFLGTELKPSYWKWACRHLEQASSNAVDLFAAE